MYKKNLNIKEIFKLALKNHQKNNLNLAKKLYKEILNINPNNAAAYNNLGIIYREREDNNRALSYYQKAVKADPNFIKAHYNLGVIYKTLKKYSEAIESFNKVNSTNAKSHLLECIYFLNGLKFYQEKLKELVKEEPLNIRIAAVAAYVSKKENIRNIYPFCKDPLSFVFIKNIKNELKPINKFSDNLLKLFKKTKYIWEPATTTTKGGYQSLGNLFDSDNSKILKLQKIIEKQIIIYKKVYKSSEDYFIKKWPSKTSLHAWHVRLLQQGYQKPHIHPSRWMSGVFYLKVPKMLNRKEGSIMFTLDSNNYKEDKNLPNLIHLPKDFDLVLFPSSLFHRTIPFSSQDERHSIAFDLVPK